jgi:hypothetical protein
VGRQPVEPVGGQRRVVADHAAGAAELGVEDLAQVVITRTSS